MDLVFVLDLPVFTTCLKLDPCMWNNWTHLQFLFLHSSCPRTPSSARSSWLLVHAAFLSTTAPGQEVLANLTPARFINWVLSEAHAIRQHESPDYMTVLSPQQSLSLWPNHALIINVSNFTSKTHLTLDQSRVLTSPLPFCLFWCLDLSIILWWNHRTRNETILLVSEIIDYLNRN